MNFQSLCKMKICIGILNENGFKYRRVIDILFETASQLNLSLNSYAIKNRALFFAVGVAYFPLLASGCEFRVLISAAVNLADAHHANSHCERCASESALMRCTQCAIKSSALIDL